MYFYFIKNNKAQLTLLMGHYLHFSSFIFISVKAISTSSSTLLHNEGEFLY